MFVRNALRTKPRIQTRRYYATRPDTIFPSRGYDIGNSRRSDEPPNASMRPHPYSETSFEDDSSTSESAQDEGSSVIPPNPPKQSPPPSNQASSAEPTPEWNSESRDVAVIPPQSTFDASSTPFSDPFRDAQDENVASRLANPFDTHKFYKALEKEFSPGIAYTLMRTTRGMLVDKTRKARADGVDAKTVENQQYLYRAALSELKTEISMRTKNESAALQRSAAAIRKDVESLSSKMKEDIAQMKHEIQMELNNRKNEVKSDTKMSSIAIEELVHGATVKISDVRTDIEQAKWDNTRRGVVIIGGFVLFVIFALEMSPKPKPRHEHHALVPKKLKPPSDSTPTQRTTTVRDSQPSNLGTLSASSVNDTTQGQYGNMQSVYGAPSTRAPLDLKEFEESNEG